MDWSLVIATYNRPQALRTCLRLATAQSRPPAEVIVVDASDAWADHRRMALDEVAPHAPAGIGWRYEQARVRSLTSQRNQAIALAKTGVLFLIDDDAYMYPGCAEQVMTVYERDVRGAVAGVAPLEANRPPPGLEPGATPVDDNAGSAGAANGGSSITQKLYGWLEREVDVARLLLPYDGAYPDRPLPPELAGLAVSPTQHFSGFRMTFRASVIREVGFDETLRRYAAAEDLDASYRASRHGLLLNALDAKIFHAQDPSARLSRHTRTLLGLLNLAYLYRRNGRDPDRLLAAFRWRVLRRFAVDVVRDAGRKRLTLPCARADAQALLRLRSIARAPVDELPEWYAALQERIIADNVA